IYRKIGEKYGVEYSETEILNRYRRAYEQPWGRSRLRYVNDGRPFWQYIVSSSTGCSDSQYFEELYNYYTTDKAWHLCDPDAEKVFEALRKAGVKVAVVSNFDTRLRPLLHALHCEHWFDAVAVSAEVEAEKPNPTIFLKACELLGVKPEDAVHVGDDRRNDIWGARDAGCDAWLWGSDVHSFKESLDNFMETFNGHIVVAPNATCGLGNFAQVHILVWILAPNICVSPDGVSYDIQKTWRANLAMLRWVVPASCMAFFFEKHKVLGGGK
ncbi:hypothetical protein C1H46_009386, partial [Malus baccata]